MRYLIGLIVLLIALPAFAGTATLTWTDSITNEAGYIVDRAPGTCADTTLTFTKVGETAANIKTFVDNTPVDGQKYCYRVTAWNLKFANDPTSIQYGTASNLAGKEFPLPLPAGSVQLTVN